MPLIILQSIARFLAIFLIQFVAFFLFYNHPVGRAAVYVAWYAWIIDLLAIVSGITLMTLSVYLLHNPWIFTIKIPSWVFLITFTIGAWQASIHAVKWLIRLKQ